MESLFPSPYSLALFGPPPPLLLLLITNNCRFLSCYCKNLIFCINIRNLLQKTFNCFWFQVLTLLGVAKVFETKRQILQRLGDFSRFWSLFLEFLEVAALSKNSEVGLVNCLEILNTVSTLFFSLFSATGFYFCPESISRNIILAL